MANLEPNLYGGKYYFYLEPNPRLTEILVSPQVQALTSEWTAKVFANYLTRLSGRSSHGGDKGIGAVHMADAVSAEVFIGGYKADRWVGEITVDVEYAMADEFGRKNAAEGQHNSTYEGSGDLRGALYSELKPI